MLKLNLHNYLPYKIKCKISNEGKQLIGTLSAIYSDGSASFPDIIESEHGFENIKPLLHPMNRINDKISHNQEFFVPIDKLLDMCSTDNSENFLSHVQDFAMKINDIDFEECPYWITQKLHEWHFDINGLILKGMAEEIQIK